MNGMGRLVLGCVGTLGLVASSMSNAGVFKCVDGDGSVTYSQSACEPEQETSKILQISSESKTRQDCRVATKFAFKVATEMKQGKRSDELFRDYGGIDSLNPSTVALINYVYSHDKNDSISVSRVTSLTSTRCEVGSFGISDCDTLPYSFIEAGGGCEALTKGGSGSAVATQQRAVTNVPAADRSSNRQQPTSSADADFEGGFSADCKTRLTEELKGIYRDMRTAGSAAEQEALNDRRNELRRELGYCK
ncbi:MAG: DUF4124 domain-containing protein [Acidiferrobacterales bacterium]|nr:DUF4124 domain-containing protein [Acidiferrobacterales bacterium]